MDILNETRSHMQKSFDVLLQDFATIRTGKANTALVEHIEINAYTGVRLKLNEVATVAIQDPHTLIVTPFDQSIMSNIEKGIQESNIGISPAVSGHIIRLSIPPLTEERRKEFVKLIHQKAESGRIMIRQVRHNAMDDIKKKKDDKSIGEDDANRLEKEVQKMTDEYMEKIDELKNKKEEEIMTI